MRAITLLTPVDLGNSDSNHEWRTEALEQFLVLRRPFSALVLFWCVVAIEDLIRDFGTRLAALPSVAAAFPNVAKVALHSINPLGSLTDKGQRGATIRSSTDVRTANRSSSSSSFSISSENVPKSRSLQTQQR
jgi:hypothetical protein